VPGQQYVWTEYGTYMGPIIMILAAVGVVAAGAEGAWLTALLLFVLLLMCGHFASWAPWTILHAHVPPFKEMRVPSRFRATVSMFLAAFAGIAVQKLSRAFVRHVPSRTWSDALRVTVVAIALIGVGDIISVGLTTIEPFLTSAPEAPQQPSTRLYYGGPGLAPFIDQPKQNRGELQCWDEWGFAQGSHVWEGDVPQARAEDDAIAVEVANRTQNTITVEVDVKRPGRILLNTVYDDDWKTDAGKTVNESQQLAIDLTQTGRYTVHAKCWPRLFTLGCFLTILGLAGTIAWFARDAKRRKLAAARPAP
jgi:hypothetical protein